MLICPRCGSKCKDSDKFCQSCGSPMAQQTAMNPGPNQYQNTNQYRNPNQFNHPYPNGNAYQQPYAQQKSNGYGIAALVLGLVGIGTGFIGVVVAGYTGSMGLAFLFLIPCLLGVVFGILGILRCKKNPAYKGLGLSIAGLVLGIIFFFVFLASCNVIIKEYYYAYSIYNSIYDLYDAFY